MGSFKWLQDEGIIEVLTSAATHGFLPLLERDSAVYSQIHLGLQTYEKYFHRKPRGIWLPECAYRWRERDHQENRDRKSIDEWLADEGIQYFFVEDVGITNAEIIENKHNESKPTTYRGYKTESGVCVFGRNNATGKQVWSPHEGYPGHSDYREFHQKDPDSGLHYWRITGENTKRIYDPQAAQDVISSQALHFQNLLKSKAQEQGSTFTEYPPLLVSPYDCELYGHWWHEGVQWIDRLYHGLLKQADISPLNLEEVVKRYGDTFSTIRMKPSTWGENSDFTVWKNKDHGWIWPYINGCSKDLEQVLATIKNSGRELNERDHRIIRQLGRELVLMEGSDWPFLLYTQQAKEYANQRFHNHHQRFNKLLWAAKNLEEPFRISENDLRSFEDIDNPWQDLLVNLFTIK
jgi:1,4-alpha-glucan branching enzyme